MNETLLSAEREDLEDIVSSVYKLGVNIDQILINNKNGRHTGFDSLNELTNGWQKRNLIILVGCPGIGKIALALNLFGLEASKSGSNILFYSLEMSAPQLMNRLIIGSSNVNVERYKSGKLTRQELGAVKKTSQVRYG